MCLGEGKSPKSSVPSVHIDRLKSRNDFPIRSISSQSSSSLNKKYSNTKSKIYLKVRITCWGMEYLFEVENIIVFGNEVAKFDALLLLLYQTWQKNIRE